MSSLGAPQPRRTMPQTPLLLLLILVLACVLHPACVVAAPQGHSVRPIHGPGYEHLDCSACLTVARTLFFRLNETLFTNPSTYLISHRLDKANQLRRRHYRNSELLVTEVMENICVSYTNDERSLRLHPKSKVRLYHQQIYGDIALGVRHALREDELYPADADPTAWDDRLHGHRFAVGTVYSPKDAEALHGLQNLAAAPTMCALIMEEFEEEVEELVKTAGTRAEVEYGLCGLALPANASGEEAELASAVRPVTNICADEEVLRAAAHRDQLRWSQYTRREARRQAKQADRKAAASVTQPPSPTETTGTGEEVEPETADAAIPAEADGNAPDAEAAGAEEGAAAAQQRPAEGEDGDGDL